MSSTRVRAAIIAGLATVGFVAAAILAFDSARWASYLASYGFAFSTLLGALVLLMIGYATDARWLLVFRRPLEAIALTLPLAVALLGCVAGARCASVHRMDARALRIVCGFAIWLGLAEVLRRGSLARDRAESSWMERRRTALASVGLPVVAFSGSLAIFDWPGAAVPGWNMTGMALYVLTGGFASALGVLAVCFWWLRRSGPLPPSVGAEHSSALGRMLLSGVCLWAYLGASQLIIVWSANLPHEAAFYLPHAALAWRGLVWLLVFGHFLAPFLLLLLREPKRRPSFVASVGAWVVLMHACDCYWLLVPSIKRAPDAIDALPFALLTLALVAFGVVRFSFASPLPRNEPELERSLHYEAS